MKKLFLLFIIAVLVSCSSDKNDGLVVSSTNKEIKGFNFTKAPFDINNAQFAQNVSYGNDARNVFDIFLPKSTKPTPLVIYIHGGGFVGGDKAADYTTLKSDINSLLASNIAFASINYRLLQANETAGVLKSLNDSKRCLQFIRYYAKFLNINPTKIVLVGASAGAGTSLWLAVNNDMADVTNSDEILRESTRVSGVVAFETQATYDILDWETFLLSPFNVTLNQLIATQPTLGFVLAGFYGISNTSELNSTKTIEYRAKVDMLELMSSDDPEIFVLNQFTEASKPKSIGDLYHHPLHAKALLDRANEVGIAHKIYAPKLNITDKSGEKYIDFVKRKLQ